MNQRLRVSLLALSLGSAAAAMACGDSKGNADQEAELEDAGGLVPDDDGGMKSPPPEAKDDAGEEPPEPEPEPEPELEGTLALVEAQTVLSGTDDRKPRAGLDVIVNRADGSLSSHGKTDADGRLEVRVPDNGSVSLLGATTVRGVPGNQLFTTRHIRTWVAPPDGYVIRQQDVKPPPVVPANEPMNVVFSAISAANAPALTSSLYFFLACDLSVVVGLDKPVEKRGYTGCAGSDTYDALAIARSDDGEGLGYAVLLNQPFKPGETITHALKFTQTDFAETTSTVAPIPQGSTSLGFTLSGVSATRPDFSVRTFTYYMHPSATQSSVLNLPASFFQSFEITELLRVKGSRFNEVFTRVRTGDRLAAYSTISPASLARVASLDPPDVTILSRPSVAFSLTSEGSREGCVHTELNWTDTASISTHWNHYEAATTAKAARFPELPEALAEYAPQSLGVMGDAWMENRHTPGKQGLAACETLGVAETLAWSVQK